MTALPVLLPDGFSPLVTVGDAVTIGQAIAQKTTKSEYSINIPQQFAISLGEVKHVLKKFPGDTIEKGDIIAVKKRLFGIKKALLRSGVNGVISRYERDSGNLVIKTSESSTINTIDSPVDGMVALCDNEKILIQTDKYVVGGKRTSGENGQGEIFVLGASLKEDGQLVDNILYYLDSQAIGKIVVGGIFSRDLLIKGIGLGVKGIVGTQIADQDMEYLVLKQIKTPVMQIDSGTIQKLIAWQGKKIYLDSQANAIIFLHL